MKNILIRISCLALAVIMASCLPGCGSSEQENTTERHTVKQTEPDYENYGNKIGELCFPSDLETFDGNTINITHTRGKVTVINFWGEWCYYCLLEMPDFDKVASEYQKDISIIAVHSEGGLEKGIAYAGENYSGSKIIFAKDTEQKGYSYYSLLGGTQYYPRTVILDRDGKIVYAKDGAISYDVLTGIIDRYI